MQTVEEIRARIAELDRQGRKPALILLTRSERAHIEKWAEDLGLVKGEATGITTLLGVPVEVSWCRPFFRVLDSMGEAEYRRWAALPAPKSPFLV